MKAINNKEIELFSDLTLRKMKDALTDMTTECQRHFGEISNDTYLEICALYTAVDVELIKRDAGNMRSVSKGISST